MIGRMTSFRSRAHVSRIDTALACLAGGDAVRAETLLRSVLAEDPDCAGAWHGLACVGRHAGQPRLAIASVAHALTLVADDREKARYHLTLSAALDEAGHMPEALAACRVALLLEPRDFRARAFESELLHRSGQLQESASAFQQALALAADFLPLLTRRAAFLMEQGAWADACQVYTALADLLPDRAEIWANLGAACFEAGKMADALVALRKAVRLDTPTAQTLNNLALVYQALGALDEAEAAFEEALVLSPDDEGIASNRAICRAETGHQSEAEMYFRRILSESGSGRGAVSALREPHLRLHHQARFNLSTLQLARGDFQDGWANFESRSQLLRHNLAGPQWRGEVTAQTVRIVAEQGLGDCLQFLRFVAMAAERAPLLLSIPETLHPFLPYMPRLASHLRSGRVKTEGEAGLSCSLLSLPHLLQIARIDPSPVIDLGIPAEKGRVGVFRAGNPTYRFDARRSLPSGALTPLATVTGYRFVNFQLEDAPEDMDQGAGWTLLDTAREMARCELVIGVDTMLAHLAGSCGVELWLLDRLGGDWRWQGPRWYADTRIFRPADRRPPQEAWPAVIDRVAEALRARKQDES